ncbi:glycosyltransferase [Acidobacteriota bacterium]
MKILFIGSLNSSFVTNLALELSKKNIFPQIFDPDTLKLVDTAADKEETIFRVPKKIERNRLFSYVYKSRLILKFLRTNQGRFDICHVHYILSKFIFMTTRMKRFARKLVVSIYGSDFYRRNTFFKKRQGNLLKAADAIIVLHEGTKNDIEAYYGSDLREKIEILRFGLRPLEYIDKLSDEDIQKSKEALNIPSSSIVVTCGYAAFPEQQQLKIIEIVENMIDDIPFSTFFLFPLTYGEESFKGQVIDRLKRSKLSYSIFQDRMSEIDVARLRRVTDILLNVQDTDQLSGSMLEHIYAGSLVITGKWLPYEILSERGMVFSSIDTFEDLPLGLKNGFSALTDFQKNISKNKSVVSDLSRWDKNIVHWVGFYDEIYNEG